MTPYRCYLLGSRTGSPSWLIHADHWGGAGGLGHRSAREETPMSTKFTQTACRRARACRPETVSLEGRVLLSWTGTPPSSVKVKAASSDRITIASFDRDGNYSHTNSI